MTAAVLGRLPARDSARHVGRWLLRLSTTLAFGAVFLELFVGANLLTLLGSRYVMEGGSYAEKLHPGSYLAFLAACTTCAGLLLSRVCLRDFLWRQRWLVAFLCSMIGCAGFAAVFTGLSNQIVLFDNFLPAGCLGLALSEAPDSACRAIRRLLIAGIALNAALGVAEVLAGAHLLPLYLNGVPAVERLEDFRPIALYDHPLTAAAVTLIGLFVPGLRVASTAGLSPARSWLGAGYYALLGVALVAFGGRAALAVGAGAGFWHALRRGCRQLLGGRLTPAAVGAGMSLAFGFGAGAWLFLQSGGGGRIAHHGLWDASAAARLVQWRILGELDIQQLFFGASRSELLANLEMLRLTSGIDVIENFALLLCVSLGLIGFPLFAFGFLAWSVWCWKFDGERGRVLVICFLLAISASNSLARKSTLLLIMTAAIASQSVPGRRVSDAPP